MAVVELILFNDEEKKIIPFFLHDTRVARIWYEHMISIDQTDVRRKKMDIGYSPNSPVEKRLRIKLESLAKELKLNTTDVHELHEAFESYAENKTEHDNQIDNLWLSLNEVIHSYEFYESTKDNPGNHIPCSFLQSWNPRVDWKLLQSDFVMARREHFGELCLGYNTLGKNLFHMVCHQDDEAHGITPQTSFSNEITVKFDGFPNSCHDFYYYKNWQKMNHVTEKFTFGNHCEQREGLISIGRVYTKFLEEECTGTGLNFDVSKYTDYRFKVNG